jgi:hypothetical protein
MSADAASRQNPTQLGLTFIARAALEADIQKRHAPTTTHLFR